MAYALWAKQMKHNPANPKWPDRDRFVLSSGHGSMLLYSLLHLFHYGLPSTSSKRFRQFGSKTPPSGMHPHPGVETTTGPWAGHRQRRGHGHREAFLAEKLNREGFPVVDHYTYAILGDAA
jgi:transketolase